MWICCTVSEWWLWFWVGFHSVWGLPKVLGTTLSNVSWKSTIVRNIIKHYCKKHFCTLVLMHVYFWILKYCILILGYQPESTFLTGMSENAGTLFPIPLTWVDFVGSIRVAARHRNVGYLCYCDPCKNCIETCTVALLFEKKIFEYSEVKFFESNVCRSIFNGD